MSVIERGSLRANPRYELVLREHVTAGERELLGEHTDLYGALRPRPGSRLPLRPASTGVALLFLTLTTPGPLPAYALAGSGGEEEIWRLVLDSVLEVEAEGAFVAGARALELLPGRHAVGGRGRVAEQSIAALRYAQELAGIGAPLLARRLYFYGCEPVSPRLRRRFPDALAVADALGLGPGGAARVALDSAWHEVPARGPDPAWRMWQPRALAGRGVPSANCKLYVSPATHALGDCIAVVASSLAKARGVHGFKVGRDVRGICRPDKLVAYFERLEDLHAGAVLLGDRLGGCPARGVPFTTPITDDGLLSHGADPPVGSASAGTSWRAWVTEQLATHLVAADPSGSAGGAPPWCFALERLRLAGIDTETWAPTGGSWAEDRASAAMAR